MQTIVEGSSIALASMRTNRLRSSLTIMGVAVGVAVVVAMAALITGIRSAVMEGFEAAGPENFTVTRVDLSAVTLADDGPPEWLSRPLIDPLEAADIARLPEVDEAIFNFSFTSEMHVDGRRVARVPTQAFSPGWNAFNPGEFVAGRNFTPAELNQGSSVLVVSLALAEQLFGQRDPLGRTVGVLAPYRSVRQDFRLIGVFDTGDNVFADVSAFVAYIPYTTALRRLNAPTSGAQVLVVPADSVGTDRAMTRVEGLLRASRRLGPRDENDFSFLQSDQILELFNRFTGVFFLIMIALSSVGLLVGGVGVIGIMLISVTERTREIGVRKALGATRRDILWQFLVEAAALTTMGGALGLTVGWVGAELVESFTPVPAVIPVWAVGVSLVVAAGTGLLFGSLPAYRAARLEPVDALRFEA